MKFIDTKGREHGVDIRPSRWPKKASGEGRGKYQSEVGSILEEAFPGCHILEEFPCKGEGLFLDFFIPRKRIAVEVQGDQHYKFNKFFHEDKKAFAQQRMRDARKARWCEINKIKLVIVKYKSNREKVLGALVD